MNFQNTLPNINTDVNIIFPKLFECKAFLKSLLQAFIVSKDSVREITSILDAVNLSKSFNIVVLKPKSWNDRAFDEFKKYYKIDEKAYATLFEMNLKIHVAGDSDIKFQEYLWKNRNNWQEKNELLILTGSCGLVNYNPEKKMNINDTYIVDRALKIDRGNINSHKQSTNEFKVHFREDQLDYSKRNLKNGGKLIVTTNHVYLAPQLPLLNGYLVHVWNELHDLQIPNPEIEIERYEKDLHENVLVDMETYDFMSFCESERLKNYRIVRIVSDIADANYYEDYLQRCHFLNEDLLTIKNLFFPDAQNIPFDTVSPFAARRIVSIMKQNPLKRHAFCRLIRKNHLIYDLKHFVLFFAENNASPKHIQLQEQQVQQPQPPQPPQQQQQQQQEHSF